MTRRSSNAPGRAHFDAVTSVEMGSYGLARGLRIHSLMQAQIEVDDTTATKRALLCRMKTLLSVGSPTTWEQQELRTIENALRRMDAKRAEPCQNCGKRFHL